MKTNEIAKHFIIYESLKKDIAAPVDLDVMFDSKPSRTYRIGNSF